jgi:FKBP-type peptidyl-prolyl cis-trans isomerase (trigger factor)
MGLLMTTNTAAELQQLKDKTFVLTLTLSGSDIAKSRQSVLKKVQSEYEAKGFRKGKAPLDVVTANLSESKLIEEVLNDLLTKIYSDKIDQYHLHPIVQPQIKILNPPITFDKDWQVEITGCELPEISLDNKYVDEIKKINAGKENDNDKLNLTIGSLLKHSQVELPAILIQSDLNNKMSQLVDQVQQANLTINQYLESKKLTLEQYQENLKIQIKNEWITNLAIDAIAREQKLTVTEDEVKTLVTKNQQLANNLQLVYYLLTQQKVFEYLKKLA